MAKKDKVTRRIVSIDEEACTKCGDCIKACMEHALEMGKNSIHLKAELFCDGQGLCVPVCPENALSIQEQECDPFEPEEVKRYLRSIGEDELVVRVMDHFLKARKTN